MKIFLATKNDDKISEFTTILSKMQIELLTCKDIEIPDVEETGNTFVENATENFPIRNASLRRS